MRKKQPFFIFNGNFTNFDTAFLRRGRNKRLYKQCMPGRSVRRQDGRKPLLQCACIKSFKTERLQENLHSSQTEIKFGEHFMHIFHKIAH